MRGSWLGCVADFVRGAEVDEAFSFKRDKLVALAGETPVCRPDVKLGKGGKVSREELTEDCFKAFVFERFGGEQLSASGSSTLLSTLFP